MEDQPAFVVATRTPETGVRMALGATAAQTLGGVLAQGLTLVGIGLAVGTAGPLLLAQAAVGMLAAACVSRTCERRFSPSSRYNRQP